MRQRVNSFPGPGFGKSGPSVLIVDDDAVLRMVLSRRLREHGFAVATAATKAEAVGAYETFLRSPSPIDLVLLDVGLRGTTGPDVLAALRQVDPHVRCCFMSAGFPGTTPEALMALGAHAVISKPFDCVTALAEQLRTLAGRPAAEPATTNTR